MEPHGQSEFDSARRIFRLYLAVTIAIVAALGLLHWFWPEVRVGRVYWFNLDKERNIPTWFSGVLFFLFLAATIIYYVMDIALDLTAERRERLQSASRLFTRQAFKLLCATILSLTLCGGVVYYFAGRQASGGAPVPRLFKKALKSQPVASNVPRSEPESSPAADSLQMVWFEDLAKPLSISKSDQAALMRFVTESVLNPKNKRDGAIPSALKQDTAPRIVFLSVSNGFEPARVLIGAGKGIEAAVKQAILRAESLMSEDFQPKWIKLDIVEDSLPRPTANSQEPLELERSLYGLAFDRQSGIAFLPEELVSRSLINREQLIRPLNIADYLNQRVGHPDRFQVQNFSNELSLFRFTNISMFSEGENVLALYRGHRIFNRLSKDELLEAAKQGGAYLENAVGSDGRFVYAYRPKTDEVRDNYNILRHAGTAYSMLELYEITGRPQLLRTVRRALDYLVLSVRPCPAGPENLLCVVENGYVKLGGNALAVIALAKYTEITREQKYLPLILSLCKWIQSVQWENGEFFVHKQSYPDGKLDNFVSQYYPGEALLALMRIYALQPDEAWLDSAEQGAQYLINVRDRGLSLAELSHDHWLLYALNELYRQRPNPLYLAHASRIAHAIRKSQNRNPQYPDWSGSYYRPPRSTPTATRSEGLYAAYLLTRDHGDPQEAKAILESIRLGLAFQMQTQFRPESAMYLIDPQRALGGFHRSLTNFEIRIDYVQHNISSLLGLYRILN